MGVQHRRPNQCPRNLQQRHRRGGRILQQPRPGDRWAAFPNRAAAQPHRHPWFARLVSSGRHRVTPVELPVAARGNKPGRGDKSGSGFCLSPTRRCGRLLRGGQQPPRSLDEQRGAIDRGSTGDSRTTHQRRGICRFDGDIRCGRRQCIAHCVPVASPRRDPCRRHLTHPGPGRPAVQPDRGLFGHREQRVRRDYQQRRTALSGPSCAVGRCPFRAHQGPAHRDQYRCPCRR